MFEQEYSVFEDQILQLRVEHSIPTKDLIARYDACQGCELMKYNEELKLTICGDCECPVIYKGAVKQSECPKDRWNK